MSSRSDILNRLRQPSNRKIAGQLPEWQDKDLFSDYPDSKDDLLNLFDTQLKKLSGSLYPVMGFEHAAKKLNDLLQEIDPKECRAHESPLINELKLHNQEISKYLTYIDRESISSEDFAQFTVGITGADCLISRTGSVLIHTTTAGGRRLSVLPPTHIVIAEEKQLFPSIEDALQELVQVKNNWSYATLITGPSRTSDIEKQLVLGAHGPKHLIVILIKN